MKLKHIPEKIPYKQAFIWLGVLAPILFLVGVLVGRFSISTAPSDDDLQKWLSDQARIEKESEERDLDRIPALSHDGLQETGDLHVANPDQRADRLPPKKVAKQKRSVEKNENKKIPKKVVSKKTAAGKPAFTIQVGAFREAKHALALIKRLQKAGFSGRLGKKPDGKGGTWFTVKVGWYRTRQEVTPDIRALRKAGVHNPVALMLK